MNEHDNNNIIDPDYEGDKFDDEPDYRFTPAKHLPVGWGWREWDDGSGGLVSPDGKTVLEFDYATKEYKVNGTWFDEKYFSMKGWHFMDGDFDKKNWEKRFNDKFFEPDKPRDVYRGIQGLPDEYGKFKTKSLHVSKDQFWQMIDDAREKAGRWQNMYEPLRDALSKLTPQDIMHWQQIFDEYQRLSYKKKLWAAAAIMLGGCSDDSFDYFRGWLTAQGKETFMAALADPESLADLKAVKAFGRETCASFYTPLKGYYEAARFGSMLSVGVDAYERKTNSDFYRDVAKYSLSDHEKANIASDIVYADDIDVEWGGYATSWIEDNAVLKKMLPKLHALFNSDIDPGYDGVTFSIVEKVCATTPDGRHMLIIQASCDETKKTVWAIGDDQVCAVTHEDCIRNDIPYNSVLIKEFPYKDHSPQSVGKWKPLIEALVEITAESYLKHDGLFHTYPQWLPAEAYEHLGKELFNHMAEGCDHIILRDNNSMDFVLPPDIAAAPQRSGDKPSVLVQIAEERKAQRNAPPSDCKPPTPGKKKSDPEL